MRLIFCLFAALSAASADGDVVHHYSELGGKPYKVAYDGRSMIVDGKKVLLLSGSVHYPRSTPEMWPSIFAKMKAAGMNAVESYVFWNYHYQSLDAWNAHTPDYTNRGNVTLFLELAAKNDLFVIWRIGPYICAVSVSVALFYVLVVSKIPPSTHRNGLEAGILPGSSKSRARRRARRRSRT